MDNYEIQAIRNYLKITSEKIKPEEIYCFDKNLLEINPPQISILYKLPKKLEQFLTEKIYEIEKKIPSQIITPPKSLHSTILAFKHDEIDEKHLTTTMENFKDTKVNVYFGDISFNTHGVFAPLYPKDNSVHKLRERIRSRLGTKGSDYSSYKYNYENILWCTIIRFTITPSIEVLNYLTDNLDNNLFETELSQVEIYRIRSKLALTEESDLLFRTPSKPA